MPSRTLWSQVICFQKVLTNRYKNIDPPYEKMSWYPPCPILLHIRQWNIRQWRSRANFINEIDIATHTFHTTAAEHRHYTIFLRQSLLLLGHNKNLTRLLNFKIHGHTSICKPPRNHKWSLPWKINVNTIKYI